MKIVLVRAWPTFAPISSISRIGTHRSIFGVTSRTKLVSRKARPHPGPNLGLAPLPRGEGDMVAASWPGDGARSVRVHGSNVHPILEVETLHESPRPMLDFSCRNQTKKEFKLGRFEVSV